MDFYFHNKSFLTTMEVHYIYQNDVDQNDPILRKVQEFCEYFKLKFKIREFDSSNFEEDRDNVSYLPAIQIYTKKYYEDTIYPNNKPLQFLQEIYYKYDIAEMERKAKKQIWESKIRYLKSKFCSLKTDLKSSILPI